MTVFFIDPGRFRAPLALDVADLEPDGAGGLTGGWTETASFYGRVEPVAAGPRFAGDQFLEDTTHRITIRHRADVKAGMRLRKAGALFYPWADNSSRFVCAWSTGPEDIAAVRAALAAG